MRGVDRVSIRASSLENLKWVRDFGWVWLTRLKANRVVNPDRRIFCPVTRVGARCPRDRRPSKGYGLIRLFKIVAPDGDIEWWPATTSNECLNADTLGRLCLDHRILPSRH